MIISLFDDDEVLTNGICDQDPCDGCDCDGCDMCDHCDHCDACDV